MSSGAPSEVATPIRYPAVALLCVDSADGEQTIPVRYDASGLPIQNAGFRYDTNTPANIQINKQTPMLFGYMTRVSLTEVNINWDIPNVLPINNTLTLALYDPSQVFIKNIRISIPATYGIGYYPAPRLISSVVANLNTATTSLGITWDGVVESIINTGAITTQQVSNNPRFVLESIGGFFRILPCNVGYWETNIPGTGLYLPPLEDDLTNMMGFTPFVVTRAEDALTNAPLPVVPYYAFIYGGYASCQYTPYVDIVSKLLTKNQNVADNSSAKNNTGSKLARIYLNRDDITTREITATYDASGILVSTSDNAVGTSCFTLRREFKTPKVISWNTTENVDIIDIEVLDYKGRPIYIEAVPVQLLSYTGSTLTDALVYSGNNTADFQFTLQATEI